MKIIVIRQPSFFFFYRFSIYLVTFNFHLNISFLKSNNSFLLFQIGFWLSYDGRDHNGPLPAKYRLHMGWGLSTHWASSPCSLGEQQRGSQERGLAVLSWWRPIKD